jgi:hypothetical protein
MSRRRGRIGFKEKDWIGLHFETEKCVFVFVIYLFQYCFSGNGLILINTVFALWVIKKP